MGEKKMWQKSPPKITNRAAQAFTSATGRGGGGVIIILILRLIGSNFFKYTAQPQQMPSSNKKSKQNQKSKAGFVEIISSLLRHRGWVDGLAMLEEALLRHDEVTGLQPEDLSGQLPIVLGRGFLKMIPIGIPTYAGMKTSFHADVRQP